jgi:hypothetical protein
MRFSIALSAAALAVIAVPAAAQVIASPEIIGQCLCAAQSVERLRGEVDASRQRYEDDKARLAALDAAIADARERVNVEDPEQVDAIRRLNNARGESFATVNEVDQPNLADVAIRYNRAVGRYNADCANRDFDAIVQAQIRARLICPIESPSGQFPR